ncbi:hypothetical protein TNCV_3505271 [Trichonephila clavipes]|uniref:Uncharacterized protein n=1 Tax=Trichonephila clavipes TaxID=2585209 RepID=A0A8X6V2W7_TRICX|nr:hypothetical protein TNCV_3505271 [Trichonephila clavipes]
MDPNQLQCYGISTGHMGHLRLSNSYLIDVERLDYPLIVSPHRSLNSYQGVISETDLLCAFKAEILERLADEDVTQLPSTSSSMTAVSTFSSTQAHVVLPASSAIPTIQCEYPLPILNSTSSTNYILHNLASSLPTEAHLDG